MLLLPAKPSRHVYSDISCLRCNRAVYRFSAQIKPFQTLLKFPYWFFKHHPDPILCDKALLRDGDTLKTFSWSVNMALSVCISCEFDASLCSAGH